LSCPAAFFLPAISQRSGNSNSNNIASGDIVPSGVDWQRVACGVCGMWQEKGVLAGGF